MAKKKTKTKKKQILVSYDCKRFDHDADRYRPARMIALIPEDELEIICTVQTNVLIHDEWPKGKKAVLRREVLIEEVK